MTAPALVMLANKDRTDSLACLVAQLRLRLHQTRPTVHCQAAFVGAGQPSIAASLRTLAKQGYAEAVCVPLEAARLSTPDPAVAAAVAAAQRDLPDMRLTLSDSLGAPGALFTLLDKRLRDALAQLAQRELDGLMLLHDAGPEQAETAQLTRRARAWSSHHHLPVTVAPVGSPLAIASALSAHGGRRHIGVAWLSIFDDEPVRRWLASDPRVAAVGAPLADDAAVLDAVAAQYSIAALRSLDDIALAS